MSKYKVYDAGTAIGAEADQFALAKVEFGGTADASIRWEGIPVKDVSGVQKIAAVAADVAWTETYTPATFTVGNEFYLTVMYPDSKQTIRKVFKHIAVAGDTATTVCNAFRSAINADDTLPITGTGTTTLVLTADVAGTGINPIVTVGATAASTFAASALTTDAQRTDAAYFASKFSGVSAADFGSATDDYIAYIVSYTELVSSADGVVHAKRMAAAFVDGATTVTNLENALNGAYTSIADINTQIDILS